jgi:hypothetical protein
MYLPLPPEIAVAELPHGIRYRLPTRSLGPWRWVGLGFLLLGTVLCAAPAAPLYQVSVGDSAPWLLLLVPAFLAVKGGIFLWKVGLLIVAGHSEIELDAGVLRAIECSGPVRWTWERRSAELRRFFVSEAVPQMTPFTSGSLGAVGNLCVITPEWQPVVGVATTRPLRLAPGYPREWLVALAEDLARRCAPADVAAAAPTAIAAVPMPAPAPSFSARVVLIQVLQQAPDRSDYEELHERPVGSRIALDETPERLTLIVPPDGIMPHRGWYFASAFVGVIALLTSLSILVGLTEVASGSTVFAVIAWGFGIALVMTGFHRSRRYVLLEVAGERLTVWQSGLLRVRRRGWSRHRLADVFVMHYPGSDEHNAYWELRIEPQPGAGAVFTLLAHRDGSELRWVATLLRRALGCPGHPDTSPPAGLVVRAGR